MVATPVIDKKQFLAPPGQRMQLKNHPSKVGIFANKKQAKDSMNEDADMIADLSHKLYAQGSPALLIVLQGMDTSGKDGTIEALFSRSAPYNIRVEAFKSPSKEDLSHDYLWRIHKVCPPQGTITAFNRSHYEDVLVVKVRGLAPKDKVKQRYGQINDFERLLSLNGTRIVKFMLNISRKTQGVRLNERLVEPHKFWKFNPGDLDDRQYWAKYMKAYEMMVTRTSTKLAPWYVIPSDDRATRNAIICRIVRETLQDINPQYPEAVYKPGDFQID